MINGHWRTGFKEFQKMVKFYAFLKKPTEFISMIVVESSNILATSGH